MSYWLDKIEDEQYKAIKMFGCIMCGLITGMCIAFDWCNLNYTNALGRHFLAWYELFVDVFDHFVSPLNVVVLDLVGHLLIQAFFVFLTFTWWYVPAWILLQGSKSVFRLATYHIVPVRRKGVCTAELFIAGVMLLISFACVVTRDAGVAPGTWVNAVAEPISRRIVPMFSLTYDWTIFPKQLLKYIAMLGVWILWYVPAIWLLELITVVPVIEIRRIKAHEPIQGGDDGI